MSIPETCGQCDCIGYDKDSGFIVPYCKKTTCYVDDEAEPPYDCPKRDEADTM